MYSLNEIVLTAPPRYLQYFSRKTGFLVSEFTPGFHHNVRWLWRHLSRCFDFQNQVSRLTAPEADRFYEILLSSGYSSANDELNIAIEEKIPWIFKQHGSGIFVPLEIFKLLMREEILFKKNFLFSLLYRLKIKEQRNFASLMGGSLEGQVSLTFEKNPLDMALVLYIWLMNDISGISDIRDVYPERGKILQTPFSGPLAFTRESEINAAAVKKNEHLARTFFPPEPVPAWDYLATHFYYLKDDIDKLFTLINRGNKGFYRSLALLRNPDSDMVRSFKRGVLIPVIPSSSRTDKNPAMKLKVASPAELQRFLNSNPVRSSNSGKLP